MQYTLPQFRAIIINGSKLNRQTLTPPIHVDQNRTRDTINSILFRS